MVMKIFYGVDDNCIDVTDICLAQLTKDNILTIPANDHHRSRYFTDPLGGVLKKIIIKDNNGTTDYNHFTEITINLINNKVFKNIHKTLRLIHSSLRINYGLLIEELPEQRMVVRYLTGNEKVLEIGGNIGRNSLVISSILEVKTNLVTLESDANIARQLEENKNLNNLNFHIENAALSKRNLIQKGWETIPSDKLLEGYNWVPRILFNEIESKYSIEFNTLVLDCEGAFYYILMDMPEMLKNIKLIIMENDYLDIDKKNYIDEILRQNNFIIDYSEGGGWGPCSDNFYEVWIKSCTP